MVTLGEVATCEGIPYTPMYADHQHWFYQYITCSHQYSRGVSKILKQIGHSCTIYSIGRVIRSDGSIQARSTKTISLILHFYIFFPETSAQYLQV